MSNPDLVSLSDAEFEQIQRYAVPLAPADRSHFLATMAMRLSAETTRGPGLITRLCGEVQKAYLNRAIGVTKRNRLRSPPKYSRGNGGGR